MDGSGERKCRDCDKFRRQFIRYCRGWYSPLQYGHCTESSNKIREAAAEACECWTGIKVNGIEYERLFNSLKEALKWVAERHEVTVREAFELMSEGKDGEWNMPGNGQIGLVRKK